MQTHYGGLTMKSVEDFLDGIIVLNDLDNNNGKMTKSEIRYDYFFNEQLRNSSLVNIYFQCGLVVFNIKRSDVLNKKDIKMLTNHLKDYIDKSLIGVSEGLIYKYEMQFDSFEEFMNVWSVIEVFQEVYDEGVKVNV